MFAIIIYCNESFRFVQVECNEHFIYYPRCKSSRSCSYYLSSHLFFLFLFSCHWCLLVCCIKLIAPEKHFIWSKRLCKFYLWRKNSYCGRNTIKIDWRTWWIFRKLQKFFRHNYIFEIKKPKFLSGILSFVDYSRNKWWQYSPSLFSKCISLKKCKKKKNKKVGRFTKNVYTLTYHICNYDGTEIHQCFSQSFCWWLWSVLYSGNSLIVPILYSVGWLKWLKIWEEFVFFKNSKAIWVCSANFHYSLSLNNLITNV